jgi:hypothetical protein
MRCLADPLCLGYQLGVGGTKSLGVLYELGVIRLERRGEGHCRDVGRSTAERDDASPIPSLEPGHDRYRATLQEPGEAAGCYGADVSVPRATDGS